MPRPLALLLLLLTACTVTRLTPLELATQFDQTKACTGFSQGRFTDLRVEWVPPNLFGRMACDDGPLCMRLGVFTAPPPLIRMTDGVIWKHEVVHALLWWNTGDADPGHQSGLYLPCAGR